MDIFKEQIIEILSQNVELDKEKIESLIEIPPNSEMGDYAFPCFQLSKVLRKSPNVIAQELKENIIKTDSIERIEPAGGYINFFVNKASLIKYVINEIITKNETFGSSMEGKNKKALIEHTSINPNASPHVGRARNALIGDSIVRLLRFEGYDVDVHYFVNDIGKQISMLLLGAQDKENINFKDLLNIYVDINNKVKENPELEKEVFNLLFELESGDQEIISKFRNIVDICIKGQSDILSEIGIKYDSYDYESDYIWNKRTDEILAKLSDSGKLFQDEERRMVLNLEDRNLGYLVVTRADKTSLYPLRDIAYSIDKIKKDADINLLVLGEDQKLYFKQIEATLNILGYKAPEVVHYSFVLLAEGKMSTRKGTVVLLEDLIKESFERAKSEMEKRYENIDDNEAKKIGYGAIKYAILKASNEKNVIFDWETALSFEGDSSPYIQYSYARICSIINKVSRELPENINYSVLKENSEFDLSKELGNFPNIIERTRREFSPHIVANYIYGVTKKFSTFYHECSVANAENIDLQNARLALCKATQTVIKTGMDLLGIECPERM